MSDRKKRLLVTGCSGRLGSALLEKFSDEFQIIGLDIKRPEEVDQTEDYYYMDIGNDTSVENVMRHLLSTYGKEIASVIHLAAYYSFSNQDWSLYQKITIEGTARLLKALKPFDVEQFIFSSTQLVYAPCKPGEKLTEESPLKPEWEYPESKVITEKEILNREEKFPVCIMRISGIYDDICHSIPLSRQIQRIYEDRLEKALFPGDKGHGAPFLHMDDFIEALHKTVMKRHELPNELFLLLGEPKTYSYDEIQKSLGRLLLGKEFTTYRIPKLVAKTGSWMQNHLPFSKGSFIKPWMVDLCDDHYELDISYSKKMIGWEPKKDLKQTLPKMVEALKRDLDGWYQAHGLKQPS